MTTLLVYHEGRTGYMASDGRGMAGERTIISENKAKIHRCGGWLIGVTGYTLASQVVEQNRDRLAAAVDAAQVARLLRSAFQEEGWAPAPEEPGHPPSRPGWILLASCNGAWLMFGDGSVCKLDRVTGAGSGGGEAQGAAAGLLSIGIQPAEALRRAVEIAIEYDSGSGGRVVVERICEGALFPAEAVC
jgi:ATP-dependent protease HslVU (ClpYQ) peptidase subunit